MLAILLLAAAAGGDARAALAGTKPIPAAAVNPAAVTGFLYQPAYSVDRLPRPPATPYSPKPGDLLLLSDPTPVYTLLYALAGTGRPGHGGLVVALPDGRLGVLEAGWNDTTWTRVTPLEWRLNEYPGTVWVRERLVPLTPDQSARLSEFAALAADRRYGMARFAGQLTPFRGRGPLRTFVVGRPIGPGRRYHCAQALVEALVYAGLADARTTRPAATYPQDLFFDDSRNPYLRRHPPLAAGGWQVPALWTRCPGGPCQTAALPYSAFLRPGAYMPPADLISPTPPTPNRR
jgi:hypothetical protein